MSEPTAAAAISPRVVAVVQARMGSTRLPGKVLMDLEGHSVLEWVLHRVSRAQSVHAVVLATTELPGDDILEERALERGWTLFRGNDADVLDRYYRAAQLSQADVVVRITSDCPLIDPDLVDEVAATLTQPEPVDYASNALEPRSYPRGLDVEVFTFAALERAWAEDSNPAWREHVTPYLYRNPDRFRLRALRSPEDLSGMRWTVDTPEDLVFLRMLAGRASSWNAGWREMVEIVRSDPELQRINAAVAQKSVA